MSRQHGQTAYYVEGEGFVGEDRAGVRSLSLRALSARSVEATAAELEPGGLLTTLPHFKSGLRIQTPSDRTLPRGLEQARQPV